MLGMGRLGSIIVIFCLCFTYCLLFCPVCSCFLLFFCFCSCNYRCWDLSASVKLTICQFHLLTGCTTRRRNPSHPHPAHWYARNLFLKPIPWTFRSSELIKVQRIGIFRVSAIRFRLLHINARDGQTGLIIIFCLYFTCYLLFCPVSAYFLIF